MYKMNETELLNQRQHELVREAENEDLARSLRAAHPNRATLFGSALFDRPPEAPATLPGS